MIKAVYIDVHTTLMGPGDLRVGIQDPIIDIYKDDIDYVDDMDDIDDIDDIEDILQYQISTTSITYRSCEYCILSMMIQL